MKTIVGIQFKNASKIYYFDCEELKDLDKGSQVIVETELGLGLGSVVEPPRQADEKEIPGELKRVIRQVDDSDLERRKKNREREKHAFDMCWKLINEKKLQMKLVNVEYFYDASKAIFYFTAEHRVDFRELVRDLARTLHTRIEMKQIGVRDETKMMGGIGCCGQPVCCATFLREFQPVSVKMAKEQNLAMNPGKISGLCGRLMCCLSYECDVYEEMGRDMPKRGKTIETPDGTAKVVDVNVLKREVTVATEEGGMNTLPIENINPSTSSDSEEEEKEEVEEEEISETTEEFLQTMEFSPDSDQASQEPQPEEAPSEPARKPPAEPMDFDLPQVKPLESEQPKEQKKKKRSRRRNRRRGKKKKAKSGDAQ